MVLISGFDFSDTIGGTSQGDILTGFLGNDTIYGGDGNDVIYGNVENETGFLGSDGKNHTDKDYIEAGNGNDVVYGGLASDILYGGNGADILFGGGNSDTIDGGASNDILNGDGGNDVLDGGKGDDTSSGGSGNDTFHFDSGDGNDIITDFKIGQDTLNISGQVIDLSDISSPPTGITFSSDDNGNLVVNYGNGDQITLENIEANLSATTEGQTIVTGVYEEGSVEVSAEHFGTIFTTFTPFSKVLSAYEDAGINIGHIRWPGGGVAEGSNGDYSLTNPNIMGADGKGLSDILAIVNELGASFSMIIPTARYLDNPELGQEELEDFLVKLLNGDFGPLPDDFTLELGNESFNAEGELTGNRYWDVSESLLTTIREILSDPLSNPNGIDFNITVQSGNGLYVTNKMLETISPENLAIIDGIVSHHLESSVDEFGFGDISTVYERWSQVYEQLGLGELEQYFSAWNVGKPVENFMLHETDPSMDVSGVDVAELLNNDIGARQAGGTISAITQMIAYGANALSVWGNVKHENSYFWHTGVGGLEAVSHGGEAFRLMNESLHGTRLLNGTIVGGQWSQDHSTENYQSFAYEDDAKLVMFLVAEDIDDENGQDVTIHLSQFGGVSYVWVEIIRTVVPDEYAEFIGTEYQRLYEVPVVTRIKLDVTNDSFTYHFEEDYEVVRIIIAKEDPGSGYLHLWGSDGEDILIGGSSDDLLEGNGGGDILVGGDGDDILYGGNDADILIGGLGDNLLTGGSGADVFEFTEVGTSDIITDFNIEEDVIDLSALSHLGDTISFSYEGATGKDVEWYYTICYHLQQSTFDIDYEQVGDDTIIHIEITSPESPDGNPVELTITLEEFDATNLSIDDFNFI